MTHINWDEPVCITEEGIRMPTCFVIQPFDDENDRKYDEVYKPALEEAGVEPYRVDRDPSVEIPIDTIEARIRKSDICLADITTDNPNVWYELGFAFAVGCPVVMTCTEARVEKLPFDIRHRVVTKYATASPSDFEQLRAEVVNRVKARLNETDRSATKNGEEDVGEMREQGRLSREAQEIPKTAVAKDGTIQPKPPKPPWWEVEGACQASFKLYQAACLWVGVDPSWPLPNQRARDEYTSLMEAIESEKLGGDLAHKFGWMSGDVKDDAPSTVHELEIPRDVLRKYIKSTGRPVPEFLKKRFDEISPGPAVQSYRSAKQESKRQERLLHLEEAEARRHLAAAQAAELRADLDRSGRSLALLVTNAGAAEARNISTKIDGTPILEHGIVPRNQREIRLLGPGGSARYILDLTMGGPSLIQVEIGWADEAGAAQGWRSELSLV